MAPAAVLSLRSSAIADAIAAGRVSASRLSSQRLCVDQRRPAHGIVVLFPASQAVTAPLVHANRSGVLRIHMEPDPFGAHSARGALDAAQQFPSHALPAPIRGNFKSLKIPIVPPAPRVHSTMAKPAIRPSSSAIQVAASELWTSWRIYLRPKRSGGWKQTSSIA